MAILRKAPNGEIVSFEDGTSEEVIAETLNKKQYEHPDEGMAVDLPDGLKHIFFDMCVNQGRGAAVKILQRAINGKGGKISVDGGFGPGTKAALAKHTPESVSYTHLTLPTKA